MNHFQILNVFSCKEKNCQDKFEALFKLRHDTVHTVIPLKEDVTEYHEITEYLMRHVLVKAYGDAKYFYVSKGNAFLALERYDDARECYDQLIKIRPDYPVAYVNKGFSLAELDKHAEAIECYDKALSIDPKNGFVLIWTPCFSTVFCIFFRMISALIYSHPPLCEQTHWG